MLNSDVIIRMEDYTTCMHIDVSVSHHSSVPTVFHVSLFFHAASLLFNILPGKF